MTSVSGVSPKASKSDKPGKLIRISIEIKGNGFEITKEHEPNKKSKDGYPIYESPRVKDSMVFTSKDEALAYVGDCIGESKEKA